MDSFKDLAEKSKNGDGKAFAEIFSYYSRDLFRFAYYRLGNKEDAEDAVQGAVLTAFTHIKDLRDCSVFKSWLFKILSNICKSYYISPKSAPSVPLEDVENTLRDENASVSAGGSEIADLLSALSPEDRSVVLLSAVGGYKSGEIAEILGCPPSTVRSKLSRSLAKLRKELTL
ncbi:MAG: RNA polymerase sigma factor [Oscillospiraceae bacterium]|nr:RNA polymerase sigma factor [Oscillospiraceae bacterium]